MVTFFRRVFERRLSATQKDIIEDDRKACCYKVGKAIGCPKKNWAFIKFLVLRIGRGVLRGKYNSKNFGNKKIYDFFNSYDFLHLKMSKNLFKDFDICYLYAYMHKY